MAVMPRTEDAAAESESSSATLCDNCCTMLQKPLVCARCKTATYLFQGLRTAHRKRGGRAIQAVIVMLVVQYRLSWSRWSPRLVRLSGIFAIAHVLAHIAHVGRRWAEEGGWGGGRGARCGGKTHVANNSGCESASVHAGCQQAVCHGAVGRS
jgi:hypothetical protein